MKKVLFLFLLLAVTAVTKSQTVEATLGSTAKAYAFRGGLYVGKSLYLGRVADTSKAVLTPSRIGGIVVDTTNKKLVFFVDTSIRFRVIPFGYQGGRTIDFASQAAQTSADSTITIPGAAVGDQVLVSVETAAANLTGTTFTAFISAPNTASVRFTNFSASAKDPASARFTLTVIKK